MYKEMPSCYPFHERQVQTNAGNQPINNCQWCDVDYNFTCYTSCLEPDTWDYDCKQCHPECFTCFGDTKYHCFSCPDFSRYHRHHERGTTCPEACGDGIIIATDYECDDGNNVGNKKLFDFDGCDENCLF